MKFLADVNIEKPIVEELREMGYDITWVSEIDCYLEDMKIFKLAKNESRILLTNDKDFGEIVFRQRLIPAGVILFRIKGQDVGEKIKSLKQLLTFYKDKIAKHFVVVTKEKIRFIPF